MFFECDCSIEPDEYLVAWDEEWKIATSLPNVWCCECGRWIKPGETYHEGSGIHPDHLDEWDDYYDEPTTPEQEEHRKYYDTCLGCKRIADRFCSGGYVLGGLAEQMEDCIGFNYTIDPSELDERFEGGHKQ